MNLDGQAKDINWRLVIFEIIAAPAHAWLLCCAWLVGWSFEFGPVDDED